VEGFSARCDAVEPHFAMPVLGGAHVMRVVVDQPGDDGAMIQVDHARERPFVLLDLSVAADREDALALDRQGLGNREPVVHGDDLAVQQHNIGRSLRRGSFAADDGDGSDEKGTCDGAHDGFLEAAACHSIMPQTRVNARAKSAVPAMHLGQAGTKPACRPPSDSITAAAHCPRAAIIPPSTPRVAHPVICRSTTSATKYMPIPITLVTNRPAKASGTSKRDDATSIKWPMPLLAATVSARSTRRRPL